MARKKKNWIAGAIKHPGALRRSLKVKKGKPITAKRLRSAAKKTGTVGRRAPGVDVARVLAGQEAEEVG